MEKYDITKWMLAGWLMVALLAGCENLPGTKEQQGAVVGGAAGAIAGHQLGNSLFDTLLGGALGAGAGYVIGANSDKLLGKDKEDARQAAQKSQSNPASVEDVKNADTADLNNDGFVTTDELVAMSKAGLSDKEMVSRLQTTDQVFDLTTAQENSLASQGVSRNVLREMRSLNREERERVVSQSSSKRGEVISQPQ